MKEVLAADDPEPQPTSLVGLLEGVPYGQILHSKHSAEFQRRVELYKSQLISCFTSNYFIVCPGQRSHEWEQVSAGSAELIGLLKGYDELEVTYADVDYSATVPGLLIELTDSGQGVFVAAEDIERSYTRSD